MIGMTDEEYQKEVEKENTQIRNFIRNNPYPSYKFIVNELILKNKDFDQFAEYGEPNHKWMKQIYENILNDDIIKEYGRAIYERGSFVTLQSNYNTLLDVVRHLIYQNEKMDDNERTVVFSNFKFIVSKRWEGIGEWRH